MTEASALVWFRRDLRMTDHAALYHALSRHRRVYCAFVYDTDILDALAARADRRVEFIVESVRELDQALRVHGGALITRHGRACDEIPRLALSLRVAAVFANHDYEPAAYQRDHAVQRALAGEGMAFETFKDQVIFERGEVLNQAGKPFARLHAL